MGMCACNWYTHHVCVVEVCLCIQVSVCRHGNVKGVHLSGGMVGPGAYFPKSIFS